MVRKVGVIFNGEVYKSDRLDAWWFLSKIFKG